MRIWDFYQRRQLNQKDLPKPFGAARALCYDPYGEHLAVGMSGPVAVMNGDDLSIIASWHHTKEPIQALAYSPNGNFLCVASHDCNVYLYKIEDEFGNSRDQEKMKNKKKKAGAGGENGGDRGKASSSKDSYGKGGKGGPKFQYLRHAVCRGHNFPVTQIDFGGDSCHFQTTAGLAEAPAREMLFWDNTGVQVRQMARLRNVDFRPWSCVGGWNVQGVSVESSNPEVTALQGQLEVRVASLSCLVLFFLSLCLFLPCPVCLSCLSVFLVYLSVCLSIYLSIYLSICLSVCLSCLV